MPVDDPVAHLGIERRSWIYDDALGVIAFSLAGDQERAVTILNSMRELQNSDGSLDFSYDVYTGSLDARKRSGAIAWAGYSALIYEREFNDSTYRDFAIWVADYLIRLQDPSTGSIKGGPDVSWYSTEHNIDSYFFFRDLGQITKQNKYMQAATDVKNALLNYHWNKEEQRFNQGINDTAGALDAQSWGGIFLGAIGRSDLLQSVYQYLENFEVNNVQLNLSSDSDQYNMSFENGESLYGYKPYLNSGDYSDAPSIVWTEGTWGVINLFNREGVDSSHLTRSMLTIQSANQEDGGVVYTNEGYAPYPYEFHVWSAVAGTAWQYITMHGQESIWTYEHGDELEDNNTPETAYDIEDSQFSNLTLHSQSDVDYYQFTSNITGKVKVVLKSARDYVITSISTGATSVKDQDYQVIELNVVKNIPNIIQVVSPTGQYSESEYYSIQVVSQEEYDFLQLIDNLNRELSQQDIEKMQSDLKAMKFYTGIVDGKYNPLFFESVVAYQTLLNKWDTGVALAVASGESYLDENGIISERLMYYATRDRSLGRDAEGSLYNFYYTGDAFILAQGIGEAAGIVGGALLTTRWGTKIINQVVTAVSKGSTDVGGKLLDRAAELRAALPTTKLRTKGNLGVAKIEIEGLPQELKAHSRIHSSSDNGASEGYVLLQEEPKYDTFWINSKGEVDELGSWDRKVDTESKILEEVAATLGSNKSATGTIDLYTELPPCASCSNVIN